MIVHKRTLQSIALVILISLALVGVVSAATTISSNIVTTGTLTVSGAGNSSVMGNLGIGTSTPSAKFAITANGTGLGKMVAFANSSNVESFTILDNGNVGIAKTNPTAKLEVTGTIRANGPLTAYDANTSHSVYLYGSYMVNSTDIAGLYDGGDYLIGGSDLNGGLYYGNEKMYIGGDTGYVGIGSTSPVSLLAVEGTTTIHGNLSVSGTTNGVKVYRALMAQTGTNAPVATVLENTLGNIVWSYDDVGQYIGTLAGGFPNEFKIWAPSGFLENAAVDNFKFSYADQNNLVLSTPGGNNKLGNTPIEIRVYP